MRFPGIKACHPACDLSLPGGVRAGLGVGLHTQEKAMGESETLIYRQNKRIVGDRFERRGHESSV